MKLHALPSSGDKRAMDAAHQMRQILDADDSETAKAGNVREYQMNLDQDILLSAWQYLNSKERTSWKLYFKG